MEGVKPAVLIIGLNWRQSFYFACSFRGFQIEVKKHQSTVPLMSKPSNLFQTSRQLVDVYVNTFAFSFEHEHKFDKILGSNLLSCNCIIAIKVH